MISKTKAKTMVPKFQVEWIVNRMHVYTTKRETIKEFRRRIRASKEWHMYMTHDYRNVRHAVYRYAFKVQDANLKLVRQFRL
jgi:hypothetical protein